MLTAGLVRLFDHNFRLEVSRLVLQPEGGDYTFEINLREIMRETDQRRNNQVN